MGGSVAASADIFAATLAFSDLASFDNSPANADASIAGLGIDPTLPLLALTGVPGGLPALTGVPGGLPVTTLPATTLPAEFELPAYILAR